MSINAKQSSVSGVDKDVIIDENANIGLRYGVKDEQGNVIMEREAECYTWQFMRAIVAMLTKQSIQGTHFDGGDYSKGVNIWQTDYYDRIFGDDEYQVDNPWQLHISLGTWSDTDNNPLTSRTMYSMWKPYDVIPDGETDNTLNYGNTDRSDTITDNSSSGQYSYTVSRTFSNQGTVKIYVKSMHFLWAQDRLVDYDAHNINMIARDILVPPVEMAAGSSKTFYYQFTVNTDDETGTGEWTITKQFLEKLRSQIQQSGNSSTIYDVNKKLSDTTSMVLSTDDAQLASDPTGFQSPIAHGIGAGELIYYNSRIEGIDNYEPNSFDWKENVYKIKSRTGTLDSTNNQLDDADTDFPTEGVLDTDYVWVEYSSNGQGGYYSIVGVNDGALDLGESISTDETVTYWIADETDPKTQVQVRRLFENQSGSTITVNKLYLDSGGIFAGKYLKHGSTSDGDANDDSVDITDDKIARFIFNITLTPEN